MATPRELLTDYLDNPAPTAEETRAVFGHVSEGEYSDIQIAALLATLRTRGETADDIYGATTAFLDAARPFPATGEGLLDTAGTGGDRLNTINITTGASLVAAALGARVVKSGNRSVSSKSGSADLLESLGLPIALDPDRAFEQFERTGFAFLFAPAYHPAVAHVQPVRAELKLPTIFNVLGPLLSPARPQFQAMGVADRKKAPLVAAALKGLGRDHALVIHGSGSDEVATWGPTDIWELDGGEVAHRVVEPAELGIAEHPVESLVGGSPEDNARALEETLAGRGEPAHRDAIAASAGALLYTARLADSLNAGTGRALDALADGTVANWLVNARGEGRG
ncbi:anthranilate phosphoribosyltransferase [Corynebacterium otitidis]|uniref:Anthranilate phosphoribosyltransferase n=1 Tax=Corynebacterium otitidis ATCC 51513 TaxID=883169 RepID=I7JWL8_9CORY|nr:anthranilate phosphoribosyltransferase [Corynebacterium otitidis]EJZ81237.1 anthranilate phosphoribosyltransferase [Corynebacterium otitidis ATCC 51513]CCI83941.1 anthranilate phosphoribosyltransferase [Corynebacterium otitidis ATCC 51513]